MPTLSCVLLVDDDQTTNYLNQLLLKRLSVTEKLVVALNGAEALQQLRIHSESANEEQSILVLLDVKMPVMNGFEFLEAYSQLPLPNKKAIVIVMLTTSLHPQDVSRLEKLPISSLLNKPLTKEKVDNIMHTHFN